MSNQKSDDAFRSIGEMAKILGVKTHILRYWEEQFPALTPLKRAGGRRHYRPNDAALLRQIHHLLYDKGYTIKGAKQALRGWPNIIEGENKAAAFMPEKLTAAAVKTARPIDLANAPLLDDGNESAAAQRQKNQEIIDNLLRVKADLQKALLR
ncbi:hypothetical protein LPB140_04295 [Sphingorhabdus lutea]|uniref:HTH merR-type domain-containing protein n=1 Tax=Sphingorhabdus lutea TaxID=1913578 RepID=A0A1L3JAJ7_9SPHN|nr:MerR family transcriptional regulator [Sphingorhabdus lutea]APG62155.1 hypothetical protein LPB140_04295 [Sphingorhabdus lutea]